MKNWYQNVTFGKYEICMWSNSIISKICAQISHFIHVFLTRKESVRIRLFCEELVRFFSDVKNWYSIFTNVLYSYQFLTHVKNWYSIFTNVKNRYQILTHVKKLVPNAHTYEQLVANYHRYEELVLNLHRCQ